MWFQAHAVANASVDDSPKRRPKGESVAHVLLLSVLTCPRRPTKHVGCGGVVQRHVQAVYMPPRALAQLATFIPIPKRTFHGRAQCGCNTKSQRDDSNRVTRRCLTDVGDETRRASTNLSGRALKTSQARKVLGISRLLHFAGRTLLRLGDRLITRYQPVIRADNVFLPDMKYFISMIRKSRPRSGDCISVILNSLWHVSSGLPRKLKVVCTSKPVLYVRFKKNIVVTAYS